MIDVNNIMPILGWVIHYGNGSTYSSAEGSWGDAPEDDVQIVEILHEHPYRTLITGEDTYVLPGETVAKFGGWMDLDGWEELRMGVVNG